MLIWTTVQMVRDTLQQLGPQMLALTLADSQPGMSGPTHVSAEQLSDFVCGSQVKKNKVQREKKILKLN